MGSRRVAGRRECTGSRGEFDLLEALLPGIYLPLYTMVTFTRIPYAEAARRAQRQDRIVYSTLIAAVIVIVSLLVHFVAKRG